MKYYRATFVRALISNSRFLKKFFSDMQNLIKIYKSSSCKYFPKQKQKDVILCSCPFLNRITRIGTDHTNKTKENQIMRSIKNAPV